LKSAIANLQRATHLVWQSSPRWTLVSLGLLAVQGLLPLASLYLLKLLIDTLTVSIQTRILQSFQQTLLWIALAGIVGLIGDLSRALAALAQTAQAEAVSDRVHAQLHAKSIQVDLEFYENAEYYNTLHRAQEQAAYRPPQILQGLIQVGQNSISLAAIVVLLTALHWSIPLLLLLAMLPGAGMRLNASGKRYWRLRNWTDRERQAYYFHTLMTQGSHAKEIRLFDLGNLFSRRFQTLRQFIRREKFTLATHQAKTDLVTQASATLAVFVTCGSIAQQTWQGALTLGGFVMYYQAFQRGQTFLRDLLSNLVSLYENSLFLKDFYEFLDLTPSVIEPHPPQSIPNPWQKGLQFHNVSFDYPNSQRSVLKAINFTLHPGETVALVGANGAGKTTLIKLICRLYEPTTGQITLDGIDLRQMSAIEWRNQISVLFQDYVRYQLTAEENIWLGNTNLPPKHPSIIQAAQQAGADTVVSQLPLGYETQLGTEFAAGEELSIGQWQKIAIARGFVRNAPLIVLDEPSSALDAKAEAEMFDKFHQLTRNKTVILISHRFSTIKMADRILVLSNGTIIESGTHDQLLAQQGLYAKLFETQAQPYRS
jgi:ATP-binding cassette, subfamily B, bacterial